MSDKVKNLVFVYGSLKKNHYNHKNFLGDSKYLGDASTTPKYTMWSLGGFPAVCVSGKTAIIGEVYEVELDVLRRLDLLEGVPHFYQRLNVDTPYGEAYIYAMIRQDARAREPIESGFWEGPSWETATKEVSFSTKDNKWRGIGEESVDNYRDR